MNFGQGQNTDLFQSLQLGKFMALLNRATLKRSFYVSFCPLSAVRPSVRPQKTSPDFAPVRPPPWSQSYTDV